MAGFDSGEVIVTGIGHIYVGDVGTPFPASISDVIDPDDWADLGYVSEEGARFNFGRDINEVMAWQAFDPIKLIVKRVPKEVAFDVMQWTQATMKLGLGGGTVNEVQPNEYEYEPPDESFIDERAFIVTGEDGTYKYRFCYRKAVNQEGVEFAFVRENPVMFPITMKVLAADGGEKPYVIQTDNPAIGEPNDTQVS